MSTAPCVLFVAAYTMLACLGMLSRATVVRLAALCCSAINANQSKDHTRMRSRLLTHTELFARSLGHSELWWRFVLIEHACMCARVVIMTISPTNPEWYGYWHAYRRT